MVDPSESSQLKNNGRVECQDKHPFNQSSICLLLIQGFFWDWAKCCVKPSTTKSKISNSHSKASTNTPRTFSSGFECLRSRLRRHRREAGVGKKNKGFFVDFSGFFQMENFRRGNRPGNQVPKHGSCPESKQTLVIDTLIQVLK